MLVEAVELVQARTEAEEVVERLLDRVGHEVAGDVVDRVEHGLADRPGRAARGRRHPALPVDDPRERELLGQVVELVPLVVRRGVPTGRLPP